MWIIGHFARLVRVGDPRIDDNMRRDLRRFGGAMDAFRSLVQVWDEDFEPAGEDPSTRMALALARYLRDGPDNLRYLHDVSNWDLERLRTGDYWTRFRQPRIELIVRVEESGALVLEWQPRADPHATSRRAGSMSDFLRFAAGVAVGSEFPANRLMHVPILGALLQGKAPMTPPSSRNTHCLEAAAGLIEAWARQLRISFDVRFLTWLLLHEDGGTIVDSRIEARAARKQRLAAWQKKDLQPHGIALTSFVRAHGRCRGELDELLPALQRISDRPLTRATVRRWIRQYREATSRSGE